MSDDLATYEHDGAIGRITLDDGKVNAFSIPMLRAVHGALDRARDDAGPVILTGREGRFSAGFDLGVFASGDGDAVLEMIELGARLCERLLACPRPVVVACPGHALAAGAFVLLAADVRIGADGPFKIGLNETQIGITVPWFVIELARHRLSPPHLGPAVAQATVYAPAAAVEAGFLDRVVPPGDLTGAATATAEHLAGLNPDAFAATKVRLHGPAIEAVRAGTERTLADIGALVAAAQA
jgi:enoyl-CoA hydratase